MHVWTRVRRSGWTRAVCLALALLLAIPTLAGAVPIATDEGASVPSHSTGAGILEEDSFDSNVPRLQPADTFGWVDPSAGVIVNGSLRRANVRHDLAGHPGVEASVMADLLNVYFLKPNYRNTAPQGVKPDDVLLATTKPGACKVVFICSNPMAPEQDKAWYYSPALKRNVVVTYDDTWVNGQRKGDGYYKRAGQRFVRFDEVAPAFGIAVHVDDRGLVWLDISPRQPISAGEACFLQGQYKDCDIASFLTPEGFGTWGQNNAFWLFGWQADTGGKDGVYHRIMSAKNIYGIKHGGNRPDAMAIIGDAVDAASMIIPSLYLFEEGANAALWKFNPAEAIKVQQAVEEWQWEVSCAMADQAPAIEVAKAAEQLVGEPVLPEGTNTAPGRGWYYVVRSMRAAPMDFQKAGALSNVRAIPGYPGKFLFREFGTREGGPLVDNYIGNYLYDAKGNYDWMVKDGEISPAFIGSKALQALVDELRTHLEESILAGDKGVRWVFGTLQFRPALEKYLMKYEPDLGEMLNSRIFFYDLPGYSANP